jgi:hypothetical protein
MVAAITSVGKRELMREARIAMRKIDAVRNGQDVGDDDLKRLAQGAERIISRQKMVEAERGHNGVLALGSRLVFLPPVTFLADVLDGVDEDVATSEDPFLCPPPA